MRPKCDVQYIEDPETGCWIWQRSTNGKYGVFQRNRRKVYAHRAFYEDANGPIPDGLQIDHLCRNRACVNPDHMEPVTNAENIRRGDKAVLTKTDVLDIRCLSATTDLPHRVIGGIFGISTSHTSRIVRRVQWAEVTFG